MELIMEPASLKQKLHHYIDVADERKLQAIYTLLEEEIESESSYTQEEIKMFYERRQQHLDGESKNYTVQGANLKR